MLSDIPLYSASVMAGGPRNTSSLKQESQDPLHLNETGILSSAEDTGVNIKHIQNEKLAGSGPWRVIRYFAPYAASLNSCFSLSDEESYWRKQQSTLNEEEGLKPHTHTPLCHSLDDAFIFFQTIQDTVKALC